MNNVSFNDYLKDQLKNPAFKQEFDLSLIHI